MTRHSQPCEITDKDLRRLSVGQTIEYEDDDEPMIRHGISGRVYLVEYT